MVFKKYLFIFLYLIGELKYLVGKILLGLFCLFCFGSGFYFLGEVNCKGLESYLFNCFIGVEECDF